MTPKSPWQPRLDPTLRSRAERTLGDLAHHLAAHPLATETTPFGASLASGEAGLALLFHTLGGSVSGLDGAEVAAQRLERAIDLLGNTVLGAGLFQGFTGIAWAAEHLDPGRTGADDPNEDLDEVVIDWLGRTPWPGEYDLTTGLVGCGVYALERWPRPSAHTMLERVVEHLAALVDEVPPGLAWPSPEPTSAPPPGVWYPDGRYNLGVAHGVPGAWPVLAAAWARGVQATAARRLLEGSINWALAQRLPAQGPSRFPYAVGPGAEVRPARTAWCYGDPGVALALWTAGRTLGEPRWEAAALDFALTAARRAEADTGIRDAGLCHGAAGFAHQLARLHQATGHSGLAAAAEHWYERTLDLAVPGTGVAGYLAWGPGADGTMGWQADPSVLTGAAGIALALHAALGRQEPTWDRFLLMSSLGAAS